jgi:hypothetical protein
MTSVRLPASLAEAAVSGLPDAAYYIPEFITEAEEEALLRKASCPGKPLGLDPHAF